MPETQISLRTIYLQTVIGQWKNFNVVICSSLQLILVPFFSSFISNIFTLDGLDNVI